MSQQNDDSLRILHLEDSPDDAFKVERVLKRAAIDFAIKRVEKEADFRNELEVFKPHIIISDYNLPEYDLFSALTEVRNISDIPFLVVSGEIGEVRAVECIVRGASDYIMKDRMERLPYAIKSCLESYENRQKRKNAEQSERETLELLKQLSENVNDVLFVTNLAHNEHFFISPAFDKVFGFSRSKMFEKPDSFLSYIHPEDHDIVFDAIANAKTGYEAEVRLIRPDGELRWISAAAKPFMTFSDNQTRVSGVIRDITDRKIAEAIAKKELLLEQREDFISTLTHDLKNPLIGANHILTQLQNGSLGELTEQQQEMITLLTDSNKRQLEMINTILEVTRFERNLHNLHVQPVDMKAVIEACLREMQPVADSRNIKLVLKSDDENLAVEGEKTSLYRVIQNLVDNAIKYSSKKSTVTLSMSSDEKLYVAVHNIGETISTEDQKHLFRRFSRGRAGYKCNSSSGLGLYLCKQIVNAHNGEIICTSSKDEGTIVEFWLPLKHLPCPLIKQD